LTLESNGKGSAGTSGPGDKRYFTIESQPEHIDNGAEPTIGEFSASGHVSFASIPSSDTLRGSKDYQEPMTSGPGDKLWFGGGGFVDPAIIRLNVFHPKKPGHDPSPSPPKNT
jgi:hypothetical protein